MFEQIDLPTATQGPWDAILVGSSFSAMFFLHGLPKDLRVLIVEKGVEIPPERQVAERYAVREHFRHRQGEKEWVAHTLFGGNSNCWWGQVPRFLPSDFELYERHGRSAPWPITYDDLEPHYSEVEMVMEVAGGGVEHLAPRSRPFAYGPHRLSRADAVCHEWNPDFWVPVSSARSNGGRRAICCTNGICDVCPIEAKFSVPNSVDLFARDGVYLLTGAEVRSVETAGGQTSGVVIRQSDGRDATLAAPLVALGANAIFNAAILIRSGLGGAATGRYLHEQIGHTIFVDIDHPNYFGGSSISAHCYGSYDGAHRSDSAAVLIESYNAPYALRMDPGRWTERMRLKLIAEDEPQERNRVTLDADGEPEITWHGHGDYAERGIQRALAQVPDLLPFAVESVEIGGRSPTEAHIQGTHRMGRDPSDSVVDATQRVHGQSGLFALGAGSFPTSAPANPTLTLSALALMSARSVA